MWRANPGDWRTNASRGAICSPARLEPSQIDLALRAAAAIGTPLAGVDLLPSMTGETYVLEVNAVPGWQVLSRTLELDVAKLVLALVGQMDSA
jgi:glutathione synthase/RimK-type ligase-like ATP-grasp enzyme